MKKKIFFTGLAIFCLGLLLGAFSSCYAFSENDMKNLLYQRVNIKFNETDSKSIVDKINITNMWNGHNYHDLSSYFDNPNYTYICLGQSNTRGLYFFICEKDQAKKYMFTKHNDLRLFIPGESTFPACVWTNLSSYNDVSSFHWFGDYSVSSFQGQEIATGWFKSEFLNTWDYTNRENVTHTAPFSDPASWTINNGPYSSEVFGFQEVNTNTHVKLASDGISMPLYYSPGSSVYFADFIDDDGTGQTIFGKLITGDELYMYYYTTNSWNGYVNLFRRNINSLNDFSSNRYININRPISGYTINKISLKSPYIITNVVYHYIINYIEDGIPKFVDYYFYIGDSNTSTINGVIDVPTSIPDLDIYHNRFNNITNLVNDNENTDNIIDSIESGDNKIQDIITDDSQVDSIIGNFLSGDNADELVSSLGLNSISSIQNPFTSIIYNVFMGIIDCFGSTENISLNFGFGGQNNIVYASQFITPANNTIIALIRYCLIFGYVYGIVWFYYRSIENLKHLGDKGISILTNSVREDAAFDWRLL